MCVLNQIEHRATNYYNTLFSNEKLLKLFTDELFESIISIANNDDIKFSYLSTHDAVVFPLALKLIRGFSKNRDPVGVPKFCSAVIYEFYEGRTRVLYDDCVIVDYVNSFVIIT